MVMHTQRVEHEPTRGSGTPGGSRRITPNGSVHSARSAQDMPVCSNKHWPVRDCDDPADDATPQDDGHEEASQRTPSLFRANTEESLLQKKRYDAYQRAGRNATSKRRSSAWASALQSFVSSFARTRQKTKPAPLSREESRRHEAARLIQVAAFRRGLIAPSIHMNREALLLRLRLELNLQRALRLLAMCLILFALVVYAGVVESDPESRLGLKESFKSLFALNESLADIKTQNGLRDFMVNVSKQSQLLMPLSNEYFSTKEGQVLIFEGIREFEDFHTMNVRDLNVNVDIREFTITAWVQYETEGGGNIVRKPLGLGPAEHDLSCWGWYAGWPGDRFFFGAHDFAGGTDVEALEETIDLNTGSSHADDGKLHYVALVVTAETVEFWVDAEKKSEQALPRPVTDCSGNTLEIGGPNVPQLGQVIFYPRRLQRMDMQEVMFAGFTLEELAEGMRPYLPRQDQADDIVARGDAAWEAAHRDRVAQIDQIHVEEALARTVFGLVQNRGHTHEELGIEVPQRASCLDIPAFGADTSCRFIDAWDPEEIDSITNKTYYNMLPSANRPAGVGADARIKLDDVRPRQYLRYDAERWPSFCGQSATFSMWVETDTVHGAALLARYSAVDAANNHSELEYALYAESYGLLVKGKRAPSTARLPHRYGLVFEKMPLMTRRHVAFVFDKDADETRTYVDGSRLGSTRHTIGTIAKLDCALNHSSAYTALGHLIPGEMGIKGPAQVTIKFAFKAASSSMHACSIHAYM